MVQLSIRCHACVPVAAEQMEQWLDEQVAELRSDLPHGTIRLSRLTQQLPSVDVSIGWLLELELFASESGTLPPRVVDALRDMRLLGLQPTLMAPLNWPDHDGARGNQDHPQQERRAGRRARSAATASH